MSKDKVAFGQEYAGPYQFISEDRTINCVTAVKEDGGVSIYHTSELVKGPVPKKEYEEYEIWVDKDIPKNPSSILCHFPDMNESTDRWQKAILRIPKERKVEISESELREKIKKYCIPETEPAFITMVVEEIFGRGDD